MCLREKRFLSSFLQIFLLVLSFGLLCPVGTQAEEVAVQIGRDQWAVPLEKAGLPNLHQVTKDYFRGAQPTAEGFLNLKKMGIRPVINLRSFHSDRYLIGDTGIGYEHIYVKAWHPEEKEVVRFLQIAMDGNRRPVFVHCLHGADRTGLMTAVYRIALCGWTKEEAIREMTEGDFGFHTVWTPLVSFIQQLDMDSVKRKAGLPK